MRFFHNQNDIVSKNILNIGRMTIPMLRAEHRFQIFVKLYNHDTIAMDVRSSDTIHDVWVRIRYMLKPEQREFFSRNCYLTFQGRVLRLGYELSDYNIQKRDTIRQSVRLLGGGKRARAAAASEEPIPKFIGVPQVKDL